MKKSKKINQQEKINLVKEEKEEEEKEEKEETKEEKQEKFKAYNFSIVIHKHDKDNKNWLFKIEKEEEKIVNYFKGRKDKLYYITHKKDTEEEHTHFIVFFATQRTILQVSKIFKLDKEHYKWIEKVENKNKMLRYLIHKDNPEKEQYNISDVKYISCVPYENYIQDLLNRYEIYEKVKTNEEKNIIELLKNETIEKSDIKDMLYISREIRKLNTDKLNYEYQKAQKTIIELLNEIEKQNEEIQELYNILKNLDKTKLSFNDRLKIEHYFNKEKLIKIK